MLQDELFVFDLGQASRKIMFGKDGISVGKRPSESCPYSVPVLDLKMAHKDGADRNGCR